MTYAVEQTCFFFPWGLTPSECASWVQAWGSILAIVGSVALAVWQTRRQLRVTHRQRQAERMQVAEALLALARSSRGLQIHLGEQLDSREAVQLAEQGNLPTAMTELHALERALAHIPLQALEPVLLGPASMLASSMHQYRLRIDSLLQNHRKMDAADLETQFEMLNTLAFTLQEALSDLERHLGQLRSQDG